MAIGGWFEKRKQKRAKEEVLRIGNQAVDSANEAMAEWQAKSLDLRRAMIADFFDERITSYDQLTDLDFDEWADIEALACVKNWIDQKQKVVEEISAFIDPEAWEVMKVLEVEDEFLRKLEERFDEVGHALAEDITDAIEQERLRRGAAI